MANDLLAISMTKLKSSSGTFLQGLFCFFVLFCFFLFFFFFSYETDTATVRRHVLAST